MLANGDTIEVGAKTRMKFALREVEVAQVGPVFKRRTRTRQEDESAVVEIDIDADGGKPSSLQAAGKSLMKRKKLMIGLGIYLGLMVLFFGVLFLANSNKQPDRPMGSTVQQLRTREEILPYLNLTFDYQLDSHMAREKTSQGHSYYERRATGDPNYLYLSVKSFSEAQAYAGGNFGEGDYTSFRTFSSAREELATQIWAHYWEAWQLTDVHRKYDEARESYRKILQMLRDPESPTVNPLYEHVQRKMERLPSRRR